MRPAEHEGRLAAWLRRGHGPGIERLRHAGLSAVGTYAAYLGYGLFHPSLRHAVDGPDATRRLPGDELVASPDIDKTFAIGIFASPATVWSLVVQLGYGRGGWYSWYPLDNGGRPSAEGVVPELQELKVGDRIADGPAGLDGQGVWRVVAVEPSRTLVLHSRRTLAAGHELEPGDAARAPAMDCSWAFVIEPRGDGGSRLLVRVRARMLGESAAGRLGMGLARRFFDTGDTVMEWTMLDGIRERAERLTFGPRFRA